MNTFSIEPLSWEQSLLDDIESGCTQPYLMSQYASAMLSEQKIDWKRVNEAILARWSMTGLKRVKEGAWKLAASWAPGKASA